MLVQAIKALQRIIRSLDSEIRSQEAKLAELSFDVRFLIFFWLVLISYTFFFRQTA